ncbi:TPA: hypothetical protein R0445_004746 [Salmonella enterica subsp. enterica serovar Hvittingfoss]|nr:hypothetical protein [Salmonella enterica subsp. enterica serovar Hvittingfoss]
MLKIGVEGADGDPLKGGGGIAKGGNLAVSSLEGARLKEYYRQVEKYGQAGVKELDNGNYRFYGDMTPSRTTGEMAGARLSCYPLALNRFDHQSLRNLPSISS